MPCSKWGWDEASLLLYLRTKFLLKHRYSYVASNGCNEYNIIYPSIASPPPPSAAIMKPLHHELNVAHHESREV